MASRSRMGLCLSIGLLGIITIACAIQPYGLLYTDIKRADTYARPRSYLDVTQISTHITGSHAWGIACRHNYLGLIAVGDSSYAAAVDDALHKAQAELIYDVMFDTQIKAYMGLYAETCSTVSGIAIKPQR